MDFGHRKTNWTSTLLLVQNTSRSNTVSHTGSLRGWYRKTLMHILQSCVSPNIGLTVPIQHRYSYRKSSFNSFCFCKKSNYSVRTKTSGLTTCGNYKTVHRKKGLWQIVLTTWIIGFRKAHAIVFQCTWLLRNKNPPYEEALRLFTFVIVVHVASPKASLPWNKDNKDPQCRVPRIDREGKEGRRGGGLAASVECQMNACLGPVVPSTY